MKKKISLPIKFIILFILSLSITLASCTDGGDVITGPKEGSGSDETSLKEGLNDYIVPDKNEQFNNISPKAGQVTASLWRDQDNLAFWHGLHSTQNEFGVNFLESQTTLNDLLTNFSVYTRTMFEVHVTNESGDLAGAVVTISDQDNLLYNAFTNKNGIAHIFVPDEIPLPLNINVSYNGTQKTIIIDETYQSNDGLVVIDGIRLNNQILVNLEVESQTEEILDLLLMVDTTGSMIDEINYLKAELADVINRLNHNTNTTIRLALMFYRDLGDEYLIRKSDFTTNIISQLDLLLAQSANGGGDTPEAVEKAFHEATLLNWSTNSTKILIHVADAPPHKITNDLELYYNSINKMSELGIRVIPVACSGVDVWTEYLFRTSALLTGGSYVFVTNDSGIGNDHLKASTGATVVEYLNDLLVRVITGYVTGVEPEAVSWKEDVVNQKINELETYALVTFDSNGGSRVSSYIIKKGNKLPAIVPPTKVGYEFVGWYLNGVAFDFELPITGSIILIAKWNPLT